MILVEHLRLRARSPLKRYGGVGTYFLPSLSDPMGWVRGVLRHSRNHGPAILNVKMWRPLAGSSNPAMFLSSEYLKLG